MKEASPIIYSPALRFKQGEYKCLGILRSDIASAITPRFIIPPPKDRDPELGRPPTKDEIVYGTGRRLAKYWPLRDAFLDTYFLFHEFGEIDSGIWLPRIFEVARNAGARPIPVVTLADVIGVRGRAFRNSIDRDASTQVAFRIESGEIFEDVKDRLAVALSELDLRPEDCVVIVDFCDADFSNPDFATGTVQAAFENMQEIGAWHQIVFQGTNYPDKNPAEENGSAVVRRNEWAAWKDAVHFDVDTPKHLVFGDYGADCACFGFSKSGRGIPIRHHRYATPNSWFVVTGPKKGPVADAMEAVCQRILNSGHFAGREFSAADDYIYRVANGKAGPGNPSIWREMNMAHHITRVVKDLGKVKGLGFSKSSVVDLTAQMDFLKNDEER